MGKIIAITETRGGPGKVLFGLNLALALNGQTKGKTAFIDLGFSGRGSVETQLGIKADKNINSIIEAMPNMDASLLKGFLPEYKSSIAVLEGVEPSSRIDTAALQNAVLTISSAYSYVIVSLPDSTNEHLTPLLEISDVVLLSTLPHLQSLKEAREFLNILKGAHLPLSLAKIVINTIDSKLALEKSRVEEFLSTNVFAEMPFDAATVAASINSGTPAIVSAPTDKFANAIKLISKALIELKLSGDPKKPGQSEHLAGQPTATGQGIDSQLVKQKGTSLKKILHGKLIDEFNTRRIDLKTLSASPERKREIRETARGILQETISKQQNDFSREDRAKIVDEMLDEVLGLGCIETLLNDPEITEIMVNGPDDIYIEKKGKLTLTDLSFTSNVQLMTVIDRIVSPLGRRIDESSPLVDARLEDGSRVNAIIPPLSLVGPSITIRKFSKKKLTSDDLVKFGAIKAELAEFLRICVQLRKNIVVSGGTGSGKTTLLNVVSSFIPEDERIVTIEDSAELKLPQKHVVRLESRPPSIEGTGEISIRRLVINALRMRPDRIVVGECRGGETLDMLQAMNTGHDGSLTTIHSNSPKDGVSRIATMVMMAGMDLPEKAIREQIASAVHIMVQLSRMSDGSRKVVEITEITGIEGDSVCLVPIFKYEQTGLKDGKVTGRFVSTGNKPSFLAEIDTHGLSIDKNIFNKGELK